MSRTPNDTADPLFTSNPEVMGGRLLFRGTRIPVDLLFDNLADGMSLDEILDTYPTLNRDDAVAAIEMACKLLSAGGHEGCFFSTGNEIIRLSAKAQKKFAELLLNPSEPPEGLKRAIASHRRLIREVR